MVEMNEIKELATQIKIDFLKVLADQTRLEILDLIKDKEHTQEDLIKFLKKSQSTISQHLNLLLNNNLIKYRKKENKKYYRVRNKEIYNLLSEINDFVIKSNKEKLKDLIDQDVFEVLWDV